MKKGEYIIAFLVIAGLIGFIYGLYKFGEYNYKIEREANMISRSTITYIEVYTKETNKLIFKGDVGDMNKNIFSDGVTFLKNGTRQELKGNVIVGRTIIRNN